MPSNSRLFVKPFIGGINTELSSVEDAILNTSDELNCTILPEGIRGRRLGFNIERDGKWFESNESTVTSVFYWDNVGKKDYDYVVVQIGEVLKFFVSGQEAGEVSITPYKVVDTMKPLRYSTCAGDLIVVGDWIDPIKISRNMTDNTFEVVKVNIKWRDLIGVDDGLAIDSMPAELSPEHKYNLFNQGWDKLVYDEDGNSAQALDKFYDTVKLYPSNNMMHFLDKTADSKYDAYELLKHFYGNTPAPKGHYILDYFNRSRTAASGIKIEEENAEVFNTFSTLTVPLKDKTAERLCYGNIDIATAKAVGAGGAPAKQLFKDPSNVYFENFLDFQTSLKSFTFKLYDFVWSDGRLVSFNDSWHHRNYRYGSDPFPTWYNGPVIITLYGVKGSEKIKIKEESYVIPLTDYVGTIAVQDTWVFETTQAYERYVLRITLKGFDAEDYVKIYPNWGVHCIGVDVTSAIPSTDVVSGRIKDITTLGGRYFYLAGDTVLFSQVLKDDGTGFDACHQEADPTSEEISDVVVTDGGYVKFPTMGEGLALTSFNRGVLVFGRTSVYGLISPMEQVFTATSYDIVELSRAGIVGPNSVVSTANMVYYWSPLGIFQIGLHKETNNTVVAQCISINTIQELYNDIPVHSKEHCVGTYDYVNNRIYWYYPTDENNLYKLDGCLVLDLTHGAFMSFKIGDSTTDLPYISHICKIPTATEIKPTMYVRVNGKRVVADERPVLAAEEDEDFKRWTALKHLIRDKNNSFSFGEYNSREFKDFDKHSYESYMVSRPIMFTGFSTFGNVVQDTANDKQVPILQTLFKRTEQAKLADGKNYIAASGANIRMRWGWSLTDRSNRWDMVQNGYRPQKDFLHDEYVESRIHVRGRGKAFQIEIRNDDNKDFRLAGMNLLVRSK